ncbi:ornithine utilization transcriptional regulator OruR [Maricurvus nonylphenolicus]|uniref:helix-turn-helix domain-containing protein n=1 Tax=Maricurvus nonylphenolicus TaxID=1008307 RepID=UPI0036F2FF56
MDQLSTYFPRIISRELGLTPDSIGPLLDGTHLVAGDIFYETSLSYSDFTIFLNNALDYSQAANLGLRFGRHVMPFAASEVGMAGLAGPNLLEVLRALASFSRLQANYVMIDARLDLDGLRLRGKDLIELGPTRRTQHEVLLFSIQNTVEAILGRPFTEGRYYLAYPEPDYGEEYRDVFHSPCTFNAAQTGADIPRQLLNVLSPFYHETNWQQALLRCAKLMEELKVSQDNVYRKHILSVLRSQNPPLPSIGTVARELHMSERSLTRRLKEEDSSYRQLQNQVLHEWACRYLGESKLSVEAIAAQLGYQDSANFRRAFKRWQGCSPQAYRHNLSIY